MNLLLSKIHLTKTNTWLLLGTLIVIFNLLTIPVAYGQVDSTGGSQAGDLGSELNQQSDAFIGQSGLGTLSLRYIISQMIKIVLSFLGVIFIILIIYAGFLWLTSAGSEEKIDKAKKIMVAAIIGLAIVLSAYIITVFVLDKLLSSTTERGGIYDL